MRQGSNLRGILATIAAIASLALPPSVRAAAGRGLLLEGTEYPMTLRLPGDQVGVRLSLGADGGWLTWQDAAIDGRGLGIAALRLNATLSPTGGGFQVNEEPQGDQEN